MVNKNTLPELNGAETLFGFVAWLTTRDEATMLGAKHDCTPVIELIKIFCKENNLTNPRNRWTDFFKMPRS
jgi:hypothetical protein